MTSYTKLEAPIQPGGQTELHRLARRCNTTAKMLSQLAIRQLFIAARCGALPVLPPLGPGMTGALGLWFHETDLAALHVLAEAHGMTPAALASLAVRHMLAQTHDGVLPLVMAPQDAPTNAPRRYVRDTWERAAEHNFDKASMILERLQIFSETGLTLVGLTALRELEEIETIRPPC